VADVVAIHGANRLIADIIAGVIGDLSTDGRDIAVLVDPEPEHWQEVGDRAVVCVLSNANDIDLVSAVRRGADAVIDSNAVVTDLARVVKVVRTGGVILSPSQARCVVDAFRRDGHGQRVALTRREVDIIRSIIAGDSVKQTALRLGIAHKTVENLQRRMFRKLEVRNRAQAVARVHELGLLDDATFTPTAG